MKRNWVIVLVVLISGMSLLMAAGSQETGSSTRVAVVTPYMANATTAYVIEQFKAEAEQKGWKVSVSDTAGDFGLLVSRIEDAVAQGVDAIVLGMGDPVQMTKGLDAAKAADIPVFGLDSGLVDGVLLNITSDNADLGRQTAEVLVQAMGKTGNVVMYTHDPHPGVRARAVGAAEVFDSYPGITVIQKVHIDVPGPVDNARKVTEDLITAKTPMKGIWAGWDEPAYGTTQALEASSVTDVKVVGIDGTDFAKGEIAKGGPFLATIEQDFDTMAATLADVIADYFEGKMPENNLIQISGNLIQ